MIYLRSEPTGESYEALLSLIAGHCSFFSLVLKRSKISKSKSATEMERRLGPFLADEDTVQHWPGTVLASGAARVGYYILTPASVAVLATARGLYSWRLPVLPEDLAFYDKEGRCFLSSTAHEREAMLRSAKISAEHFERSVPGVDFRWYEGER